MKIIDNKFEKFGDDLKNEIQKGDKCLVASAVFSMAIKKEKMETLLLMKNKQ